MYLPHRVVVRLTRYSAREAVRAVPCATSTQLYWGSWGCLDLLLGVGVFHRNRAGVEIGMSSSARRALATVPSRTQIFVIRDR